MFDNLFGRKIDFSGQVKIKKNCYSCDWSKEVEDDIGTTLTCFYEPTTISCHKRQCKACSHYQVDKEVNKWYDQYEVVEEE